MTSFFLSFRQGSFGLTDEGLGFGAITGGEMSWICKGILCWDFRGQHAGILRPSGVAIKAQNLKR